MIGTLLNARFRLECELGQGGTGVVYRAHDTLLERDVAVKVLSKTGLGSEGRVRLLHEAQAAARLNHPNIVGVYDAGEVAGLSFIVMELLEGSSLYDLRPRTLKEILPIAQQICTALEHAHAHGIIHRDLKPENVIIAPDGNVKLTDFGLARSVSSRLTVEGSIVGTVFYLPPEQALGKPIDGRTDLYALGVILYELVAGQLPFSADDPLAVISQHLHAPVVPPSSYNPAIPQALDTLIVQMLSKRLEDRPVSAAAVHQALDEIMNLSASSGASLPERSPLEQLARGRLVGRERELAEARRIWYEAAAGRSERPALVISGESGVGKTPFLKEIRTLAEVTGGRALTGACYIEGGAPYGPVIQILREALNHPAIQLPDLVMADLVALSPDLQASFPQVGPNPALTPSAEQQRLFESFVILCSALSRQAPLLVIVEDVQWADTGTLALLRYLARRCRASRLRLLIGLTYHDNDLAGPGLDAAHPLNGLLIDFERERLGEQIRLARFDREGTRQVLKVLLQEEVPSDFLAAVYQETEGNQFYIEELCKALIEQGKLYREGNRWCWTSLDEIQVPQSVRLTVLERVNKLPTPVQDLLRLAAVVGREFDFNTLEQASGLDEEALIDALEAAERAQLIGEVKTQSLVSAQAGGMRFAFAHGLISAALRENVSGLRRVRLHRRIASAIEKLHPDDFEALAAHFSQAGDEEHARDYLLRAADRAARLSANEEALGFYSKALERMPADHPDRFETLAKRSRVYDITARREEQRTDALEMLALAEAQADDARRCDALLALADVYLVTDPSQADELAERAASLARGLADIAREAQALRRLGWSAYERFDFARSRSILADAARRFKDAHLFSEAAACLSMLSLPQAYQGDYKASRRSIEEAIVLSRAAGDRRLEAITLRRVAAIYTYTNEFEQALVAGEAALKLHREIGDRAEEGHAYNVLGIVYGGLGQRDKAESYFVRSLEMAGAIGMSIGVSNAVTNLIWEVYTVQGKFEAALALLEDLLAKIDPEKEAYLFRNLEAQRSSLYEVLGQYQRAVDIRLSIQPITERLFSPRVQLRDLAYLGLLQAELGRFELARENMTAALAAARREGIPGEELEPLVNLGYLAVLDPAGSDLRAALAGVEEAVQLTGDVKDQRAYALWIAGELHLALDEPEAALTCLEETLKLARELVYFTPWDRFLFTYSRALRGVGRVEEADRALQQAYEWVISFAGKLQDESLRSGWLAGASWRRGIIVAWQARRGEPPEPRQEQAA
jgi:predicted ATPase